MGVFRWVDGDGNAYPLLLGKPSKLVNFFVSKRLQPLVPIPK